MGEIYLDRAGSRLFAADQGRGAPIILLHGGLATHEACVRFAAPLAERFRLITPDLRGSGRSHYAGELRWDLLADDVAAIARELGIARAVIGGVSFGAGVALAVALRHAELVAGLALLSPAYGGADVGLAPAQRAAMQAMDACGRRTLAEGMTALWPLLETLPPELRERARASVLAYDPASVAATTRFMASGVQPFASAHELEAITAPVLLVPGTDATHPAELCARFAHHLPRSTTRAVEIADYAATLATFADEVAAGSAS